MSMIEPQPCTAQNVHDVVLKLLKGEKFGKILDVGAGEGALTKKLLHAGFDVEPCDYNPDQFKIATKKCKQVDLNLPLPYPEESFDFVVCIEVIEHLRDPWHLVSELGRVLKKTGKLILTTPNVLSLKSRIHFLLYGELWGFENASFEQLSAGLTHFGEGHINPIAFSELNCILQANKLNLQKITTNRYTCGGSSFLSKIASRATSPIIKRLMTRRFGKNSLSNSDELLYGEILILKAERVAK